MHKYELINLNLEVTRRCNLQCDFCARGRAQNLDMSHEVIDAALDQMQGVYIHSIRLNGGEPFLAPDVIEYIVDGVIKRRLAIAYCHVFSNGTVRDPDVRDALCRLADYLQGRKAEEEAKKFEDINVHNLYRQAKQGERVSIIISQRYHDNNSDIPATMAYYENASPLVGIGLQDDLFLVNRGIGFNLDGLAVENIGKLIGDDLQDNVKVRVPLNQYSFLEWTNPRNDESNVKRFLKAIGIAANGNVYIGCLMAYDRLDASPVCHVTAGNILQRIEDYCWEHPITRSMNNVREHYAAIALLHKNGIQHRNYGGLHDAWLSIISVFEERAKAAHKALPDYSPDFVMSVVAIKLGQDWHISFAGDNEQAVWALFVDRFLEPIGLTDEEREDLKTEAGRLKLKNLFSEYMEAVNAESKQIDVVAGIASMIPPAPPTADLRRAAVHDVVTARELEKRKRIDAQRTAQGLQPIEWAPIG